LQHILNLLSLLDLVLAVHDLLPALGS
jgi:hypothetical protein